MTKSNDNLKTQADASGKSVLQQRREIEDGRRAILTQLEDVPIDNHRARLSVLDRICRRAEVEGNPVMVLCALERAAVEAWLLESSLMDSGRCLH